LKTIWQQRDFDAKSISSDYPELISKLLAIRGLKETEEIKNYLSPRLSELKDPQNILNMKKGVDRLVTAFANNEVVCVYADFDLDGTSGLALMADGLKQLGYQNVVLAQPLRLADGYGFHSHILEELKEKNVSVVITVDVGITALEACLKATELNIDVILTDHHQPGPELPAAYAVINPNQKEDTSGLGYLCGAGVAFYLLRALKRGLLDAEYIQQSALDFKSLLDCFCIATLTDMVPLIGDNRVLVKQGLIQLQNTVRPGLKVLLEELGLTGRMLTSSDVAIRFAPKLNALSRMEMGILPKDIYLAPDMATAQKMVKTVLENNATRVQLQAEGEAEALAMLDQWPHEHFIFISSRNFHKGVVGLIATKISQLKNVPTFVGAEGPDGVVTGSGRRPPGSAESLLPALTAAKNSLNRFGGHDAAAGFEFFKSENDKIIEALADFYSNQKSQSLAMTLSFDTEATLSDVNATAMQWLESLGPFGTEAQTPILCFRRLVVQEVLTLRGGHLKLKLQEPESFKKMDALYFSPPVEKISEIPGVGGEIDILGEVQWNYFAGRKSVQILVKDCQASRGNA
jgi:single-stranded-DNA-specific exonuclease